MPTPTNEDERAIYEAVRCLGIRYGLPVNAAKRLKGVTENAIVQGLFRDRHLMGFQDMFPDLPILDLLTDEMGWPKERVEQMLGAPGLPGAITVLKMLLRSILRVAGLDLSSHPRLFNGVRMQTDPVPPVTYTKSTNNDTGGHQIHIIDFPDPREEFFKDTVVKLAAASLTGLADTMNTTTEGAKQFASVMVQLAKALVKEIDDDMQLAVAMNSTEETATMNYGGTPADTRPPGMIRELGMGYESTPGHMGVTGQRYVSGDVYRRFADQAAALKDDAFSLLPVGAVQIDVTLDDEEFRKLSALTAEPTKFFDAACVVLRNRGYVDFERNQIEVGLSSNRTAHVLKVDVHEYNPRLGVTEVERIVPYAAGGDVTKLDGYSTSDDRPNPDAQREHYETDLPVISSDGPYARAGVMVREAKGYYTPAEVVELTNQSPHAKILEGADRGLDTNHDNTSLEHLIGDDMPKHAPARGTPEDQDAEAVEQDRHPLEIANDALNGVESHRIGITVEERETLKAAIEKDYHEQSGVLIPENFQGAARDLLHERGITDFVYGSCVLIIGGGLQYKTSTKPQVVP